MGIDVGSTTVKILILDTEKNEILYNHYERHHAEQWNTTQRLLKAVAEKIPGSVWFNTFEEVAQYVFDNAEKGDLVITLGCGDIYKAAKILIKKYKDKLENQ